MRCCQHALAREPLLLSTQTVISLSLKTMLNHVDFVLFLLKPAGFLSVKSFGSWVSHVCVGVFGARGHGLKFLFFLNLWVCFCCCAD
jgi:hypothetical protein